MLHRFAIFCLLLVLISAAGCETPNLTCVRGNGNIDTELRQLNTFTAIASTENFDVTIIQGEGHHATVEAEANLMQHIQTKVDRGTLQIGTVGDQCLAPTKRIRVKVTVPNLSGVLLAGSGDIDCDSLQTASINVENTGSGNISMDIAADELLATLSGSGNVTISGFGPVVDLLVSGSGNLSSLDFTADTAYVFNSGSGNLLVHADSLLVAELSGSGDILYTGSPELELNDSGSGEIKMY